eukprot:COSAG06_NODE_22135_length_733_cov_0.858044_1_plen_53_part_10
MGAPGPQLSCKRHAQRSVNLLADQRFIGNLALEPLDDTPFELSLQANGNLLRK